MTIGADLMLLRRKRDAVTNPVYQEIAAGRPIRAFLEGRTLVILGVHNPYEFIRVAFNFAPSDRLPGWYGYIGAFAERLSQAIADRHIDRIVGHSLGGGAAQYISWRRGIPAVTFAAPAMVADTVHLPHAPTAPVRNILLSNEIVRFQSSLTRYEYVGQQEIIDVGGFGVSHTIPDYLAAIDRIPDRTRATPRPKRTA